MNRTAGRLCNRRTVHQRRDAFDLLGEKCRLCRFLLIVPTLSRLTASSVFLALLLRFPFGFRGRYTVPQIRFTAPGLALDSQTPALFRVISRYFLRYVASFLRFAALSLASS
jgi:hypothetical protein